MPADSPRPDRRASSARPSAPSRGERAGQEHPQADLGAESIEPDRWIEPVRRVQPDCWLQPYGRVEPFRWRPHRLRREDLRRPPPQRRQCPSAPPHRRLARRRRRTETRGPARPKLERRPEPAAAFGHAGRIRRAFELGPAARSPSWNPDVRVGPPYGGGGTARTGRPAYRGDRDAAPSGRPPRAGGPSRGAPARTGGPSRAGAPAARPVTASPEGRRAGATGVPGGSEGDRASAVRAPMRDSGTGAVLRSATTTIRCRSSPEMGQRGPARGA